MIQNSYSINLEITKGANMERRVKICGIQNLEEAMMCVDAGADAIGFLIGTTHKAEDTIAAGACRDIVSKLPPLINTVMVTHLTRADDIIPLVHMTKVNTLQLHNELPFYQISVLKKELPFIKIIKCVHVNGNEEACLAKALTAATYADAILLDSKTEDRLGGTGITHDWNISSAVCKLIKKPLILAGGLTPQNVTEAVNKVMPYGIDVNSGVENAAGQKDAEKVKQFIERGKRAD